MIDFQPIQLEDQEKYNPFLHDGKSRGCEYSFANLYLWGRQKAAVVEGQMVCFPSLTAKPCTLILQARGIKSRPWKLLCGILRSGAFPAASRV